MTTLLWPNFGAEEKEPERVPPHERLEPLAAAWSFLFAGDPVVENLLPRAPTWLRVDLPAFDWLTGVRGLVPWLATPHTQKVAHERALSHWAPDPEVARRVGDKAWAVRAARRVANEPEPFHSYVVVLDPDILTAEAVEKLLAMWPAELRARWTLKPRHGSSGRGRVKGLGSQLDERARNAIGRLRERGGAILEPWVERRADLSAQLFLSEMGPFLLGTQGQMVSPSGVYRGNMAIVGRDRGSRADAELEARFAVNATEIAELAHAEGMRGPIGIDAFVYEDENADLHLRSTVEVNARFTTGTVALGIVQRALQAELVHPPFEWRFSLVEEETSSPDAEKITVVEDGAWLWLRQLR